MSPKRGRYRSPEPTGKPKRKDVVLDPTPAKLLRSMSEVSGISENALINQAVMNYAPVVSTAASRTYTGGTTVTDSLMGSYTGSLQQIPDAWDSAVTALAGEPETPKES